MLTTLLLLALSGQQAEPTPAPVKEKKICRAQETTGSRLASKRICKTQAEWDEIAANARNDVESTAGRLSTANGR
ncbi:hypothetical protein QE385_002506 [Sphingomonas sp. SORGH_AS 950]|uniref:hypothetical protein n=1 Tax=unclassified Sphingomonas TaxID=196159 RepID=UPI00278A7DB7|nr:MULTISPECIES: hypothetical protein [unclassified Sphingomonas]MDQ1158179.1 hypothetical protein [Sphingomonas sp. SORGH_AS_0950]MDR6113936.1 hypothetical protein [Sphingomonas sp. SORGH_AS_0789]MDR6144875.1 hypothetical protein [Sphingomonas sp. SORGH_AS_0870]MDR6148704.1 hypothetical protein [Sphingomonas sp. SORGH_AS_0742]